MIKYVLHVSILILKMKIQFLVFYELFDLTPKLLVFYELLNLTSKLYKMSPVQLTWHVKGYSIAQFRILS